MALYGELSACEGRGGQDRALAVPAVRAGCRPGRKVNAQARAQPLKTAGSGGHILPGMANKPLRPLPEGTALYGAVILERGLNMAQAMSRGEQP